MTEVSKAGALKEIKNQIAKLKVAISANKQNDCSAAIATIEDQLRQL